MEKIESLLCKILADRPSSGTLVLILSRMKEDGHLKKVIQECIRALRINPDDIPVRRLLAETYLESGQISQAESELSNILTRIDHLVPIYRTLADILIKQKREKEAIDLLNLYLAHRPDDRESNQLLITLQSSVISPIEIEPEEVEERLPDIATATLAEIYFQQNKIREAIEIYEKVIVLKPDDHSSRQRLEELRDMIVRDYRHEKPGGEVKREGTLKTISILERWLTNMRKQFGPGISPT